MRMVTKSLEECCTSLEEFTLYAWRTDPRNLYTILPHMTELKALRIGYRNDSSLLDLYSIINKLTHLEVVALVDVRRSPDQYVTLLNELRTRPLRVLRIDEVMAGVLTEVIEKGALRHEHLEELQIHNNYNDNASINSEDIRAMRKMINAGQTPRLKFLSLCGNLCTCQDRPSLISLLETIDRKLPSCVLKLYETDLPSNFHPNQYARLLVTSSKAREPYT